MFAIISLRILLVLIILLVAYLRFHRGWQQRHTTNALEVPASLKAAAWQTSPRLPLLRKFDWCSTGFNYLGLIAICGSIILANSAYQLVGLKIAIALYLLSAIFYIAERLVWRQIKVDLA